MEKILVNADAFSRVTGGQQSSLIGDASLECNVHDVGRNAYKLIILRNEVRFAVQGYQHTEVTR